MAMQILRASLPSLFLCLVTVPTNAQTDNLLLNPQAELEAQQWRTLGQVAIEEVHGNRCFVVRNGGSFYQDVTLPRGAAGQYVVFIGRGSSERVNPDGSVTDLPYLYGYMLAGGGGRKERVLDYLQGQAMLGRSAFAHEWVEMSGIFIVPEGATKVRFFLNQGLGRGVERDGSAARFDDVGLYIFPTEEGAKAFARRWPARHLTTACTRPRIRLDVIRQLEGLFR